MPNLLHHMIGTEEPVLSNFSMSSTKFRYCLTEALQPYFEEELKEDLSGSFYTVWFDETVNNAGYKELVVGVKYWSEKLQLISSRHLRTYFIGTADGGILFEKINDAIRKSDLPLPKLISISMDGPNVNKTCFNLMNKQLIEVRKHGLVNVGTCDIHICHNAFVKGLKKFGMPASDFIIAVHHFFDDYPSRSEDFKHCQKKCELPEHGFLKHVSSRWLTLEPAGRRVLEQWKALNYYFLSYVPNKKKDVMDSKSYKSLVQTLKNEATASIMKLQIKFVCNVAHIFTRFTGFFQTRAPLIHILYDELRTLVKRLMLKIVKPEILSTKGITLDTLKPDNLLKDDEIDKLNILYFDEITPDLKKLEKEKRLEFLREARSHIAAACEHMIKKSSLNNDIVKHCRSLNPKNILNSSNSQDDLLKLAKALPFIQLNYDDLITEFILLKTDEENLIKKIKNYQIDYFYSKIFLLDDNDGRKKYPNLTKLVKCILCIAHGNADAERDFSLSSHYLLEDRASMTERTLNAAKTVKDALRCIYGNKPQNVLITDKLIKMARLANKSYKSYLEEKKQKKILEEKEKQKAAEEKLKEEVAMEKLKAEKKNLIEEEKKIEDLKREETEKLKSADFLFKRANELLEKGVGKKDFHEVEAALAIMQSAKKSQEKFVQIKKQIGIEEKELNKRKLKLSEKEGAIMKKRKK